TRATWNEALLAAVEKLKAAGSDVAAIAGSGLSNEDLYALRQLLSGLGSDRLGAWPPTHAGADLVAQVGVGKGTNLSQLGKGDAVLIIASDLEEEVPIWRLRLKRAHDRGAYVVVANGRSTRMDDFASETIRYETGMAAHTMANLRQAYADIANRLAGANNLVIVTGAEGLTLAGSRALMQAAANFLIESGHIGRPNNGLLSTFPGPNGMGQYYMGFTPENTQAIITRPPKVLIVAQADVLFDDPDAARWLNQAETVINLTLFQDELGEYADITLPIQSFAERDGTFTNGERRVQRFYTAHGPVGEALPAWQIISRAGEMLGQGKTKLSAAALMLDITKNIPAFEGCRYQDLAWTEQQYPIIGDDVYYGGTAYRNRGGLGVQIATAADSGEQIRAGKVNLPDVVKAGRGKMLVVPTTRLYNRERMFRPSAVVHGRIAAPHAGLNSDDAKRLKVADGDYIEVEVDGGPAVQVQVRVDDGVPAGTLTLPRHLTTTAMPLALASGKAAKVTVAERSKVGS
ncbi:MAG TPA: molybdopterin-dependent oxidoreductase, partial [Spirillospora sp.]|nr:molybdopterin-dependent oxidoreductase [Spirillospora sp.]